MQSHRAGYCAVHGAKSHQYWRDRAVASRFVQQGVGELCWRALGGRRPGTTVGGVQLSKRSGRWVGFAFGLHVPLYDL